ncbi:MULTISPECIES: hypothetical protein [unclassified Clostridium]|uniref:hypothetical protein n=1 Tax=unclassified Clostridium TaxID=2614128 RepID=UPI0002978227|nr:MULTISPECIES: hypothetical protein [unclassified Clostridium]EKQ53514.1 MAG: hypothetical protein A370_03695 [Clostridium sp. Maddingley MBC34-26]
MKKIIYALTGIVITTTLMVGCSKTSTGTTQAAQGSQNASTEDGTAPQKNFQAADLQGEVSSIDGNKITLKLIKAPERPQGGDKKNANQNGDQKTSQDNNKDGQPSMKQANRQVEYTGETKDITVSDGIQITTMSRGKQNTDAKTLTASDIKVGDILSITYSDKEKETISKIVVRQAADQNAKGDANSK